MADQPHHLFFELRALLKRNVEIASSNAIQSRSPLLISGVGELSINLRETLRALEKFYGLKCPATHDLAHSEAGDLNNLINRLRNSFAHTSTTKLKDMDDRENRLSWGFQWGKGILVHNNGIDLGCEYADDIGIIFGKNVVLLKRHLLLAHNYCSYAVQKLDEQPYATPTEIFSDPVVQEHRFWKSNENDLHKIGLLFK